MNPRMLARPLTCDLLLQVRSDIVPLIGPHLNALVLNRTLEGLSTRAIESTPEYRLPTCGLCFWEASNARNSPGALDREGVLLPASALCDC